MTSSLAYLRDDKFMPLSLEGQRVANRLEILNRINCGSYSEIYLARNLSPRPGETERVVVKALNLNLRGHLDPALERTLIENIQLEALTLGRLHHDHIVRFHECGTDLSERTRREFYYVVMEYLPGGDLGTVCRGQPLTFDQAVNYVKQISQALSYAHEKNVLHRDVKPNNIMLTADRRIAKLLDFGTVRLLDETNSLITQVGTEVYSPPEIFSRAHLASCQLTAATDVYSLAKTTYFLLTGESPIHQKQRQISSLPAHVAVQPWSSSVQSVLYKATHEHPDDRHQSVLDFYNDLRNIEELTRVMPRSVRRPSFESGTGKDRVFTRINVPVSTNACSSAKDAAPVSPGIEAKEAVSALGWLLIVSEKLQSLRNRLNFLRMTAGIRVRESIAEMTRMLRVRVLGVIVLTMILLIVPPYLPKLWQGSLMPNQLARNGDLPDAAELNATTDLNLRSGPSGKDQKIGLAEHYSRVRILTCNSNNTWCEIEVLQHARAKQDANSADRGWVNRRYLSVN